MFAESRYADIEKSADIADADINIGTPLVLTSLLSFTLLWGQSQR